MAKIYCKANNLGKGFITNADQENVTPLNVKGYPGNVCQS